MRQNVFLSYALYLVKLPLNAQKVMNVHDIDDNFNNNRVIFDAR